ncbi:hypothetical protein I4U23_015778 [Adineta vaga]|nr:hypothetical protein I4U23_015778 [Adineta vaga]
MNTEIHPPPYADLLVILAGNNDSDRPKNLNLSSSSSQNRLHRFCDLLLSWLITLAFLSYTIYQIILAVFNCRLENTYISLKTMRSTYLDRFPPELFYEIFPYFTCDEIFLSFYSINDYINNVVSNYNGYYLDFSKDDIRKAEFDSICSIISPSQVVGLKISKTKFNLFDHYLLGQSNGQSFTRLDLLWLHGTISYDEKLSKQLRSLINFDHLRSFRFDCPKNRYSTARYISLFKNVRHLIGYSSKTFQQLCSCIPRHLRFLHMFFDSIDDLRNLVHPNAHQLYSLGVGILCIKHEFHNLCLFFNNHQWTHLVQFNLNLQEIKNIRFQAIQYILSSMFRLKYLTIVLSEQVIDRQSSIFNGYQWKLFISKTLFHLIKFNLKIAIEEESEIETNHYLNTFQTSWWIKEKRWFVEYVKEEQALMTVPYFSTKMIDNSTIKSFSLWKQPEIFCSNIREMKINFDQLKLDDQYSGLFVNVNRLSFDGHLTTNSLINIRQMIHIDKIEYFHCSSTIEHVHDFTQFIQDMTNLLSLSIQCVDALHLFDAILSPLFSIRRLILLDYSSKTRTMLMQRVCFLFPALIDLTIKYHSKRLFCYLVNELIHLENVSFDLKKYEHVPNRQWIGQHTRLANHLFQSEVFNINYQKRIFVLWINRDKINFNQPQPIRQTCPIQ